MKFVCISDTHNLHKKILDIPQGDVIIHAGDVSSRGSKKEIKKFLNWYANLDFKYKIFIAGNHDFYFEEEDNNMIQEIIPENIIYLNDSACEIEGIKIWGSPVQPWFYNWAFNRQRGEEIQKHWDLIPKDTDILITHGPPFNILDTTVQGMNVGCENLINTIKNTNIKFCIFGHIHEAYGEKIIDDVHYINASIVNFNYHVVNSPIVFEI